MTVFYQSAKATHEKRKQLMYWVLTQSTWTFMIRLIIDQLLHFSNLLDDLFIIAQWVERLWNQREEYQATHLLGSSWERVFCPWNGCVDFVQFQPTVHKMHKILSCNSETTHRKLLCFLLIFNCSFVWKFIRILVYPKQSLWGSWYYQSFNLY